MVIQIKEDTLNDLKREFDLDKICISGSIKSINSTLKACYKTKIFINGTTNHQLSNNDTLRNRDDLDKSIYNYTAYMLDFPKSLTEFETLKNALNRENKDIRLILK